MALLRFPTVRDLCDAFPTALEDVGIAATDEPSLAFLRSLATSGAWNAAVSFCAYMLPRREAVSWGCRSLRSMQPQLSQAEMAALNAAETWVREPQEDFRRAALDLGNRGDAGLPATWMALAAGWSGGSIGPPEFAGLRAPPEQTARAVRTGLLIAIAQLPRDPAAKALKLCLESGMQLIAPGA